MHAFHVITPRPGGTGDASSSSASSSSSAPKSAGDVDAGQEGDADVQLAHRVLELRCAHPGGALCVHAYIRPWSAVVYKSHPAIMLIRGCSEEERWEEILSLGGQQVRGTHQHSTSPPPAAFLSRSSAPSCPSHPSTTVTHAHTYPRPSPTACSGDPQLPHGDHAQGLPASLAGAAPGQARPEVQGCHQGLPGGVMLWGWGVALG